MADWNDFSLPIRMFLRAYRWRRIDPVPWTALKKPLAEAKLALISSAGLILPEGKRFDETILGGDTSFREIPMESSVQTLVDTHRSESFDHTGISEDKNLAFPLDRLKELVQAKRIGALNHRHLSFMGSIVAPGRLIRDTAPAAIEKLVADGVDAVILTPV